MTNPKSTNRFDVAIFLAVVVVLFCLLILLVSNLAFQYLNYREGIRFALANPEHIDHSSVITYSRAWDFAVVKTSSLFLSFLLVFTGALYVLRTGETNFELKAENANFRSSLSSSSPGLVMVTLGVFLAAYVLSSKTYIEYNPQISEPPQKIKPNWKQSPTKSIDVP